MAYEQDANGVPINMKSFEDLQEDIKRVAKERAEKVHEERAQRKTETQPIHTEKEAVPEYQSKLKSDIGHEIEKAKTFGHAVVGLGERKPVSEKIYSELKKEYTKFDVKRKAQAEKQAARDEKLEEAHFSRKLKRVSSGEERRHRRVEEVYEPRTKASGKRAVAGGFNLRTVRPTERREYREVPRNNDVFGMNEIFRNSAPQTSVVTQRRNENIQRPQGRADIVLRIPGFSGGQAPQTNIGQRRTQAQRPQPQYRSQSADSVLGLTSYSKVGNVPSTSIGAPRRSMEANRRTVVSNPMRDMIFVGRNPVQSQVGRQVSTKLSKESKIKTRIILQKEDPLAFLRI